MLLMRHCIQKPAWYLSASQFARRNMIIITSAIPSVWRAELAITQYLKGFSELHVALRSTPRVMHDNIHECGLNQQAVSGSDTQQPGTSSMHRPRFAMLSAKFRNETSLNDICCNISCQYLEGTTPSWRSPKTNKTSNKMTSHKPTKGSSATNSSSAATCYACHCGAMLLL